MLDLTVCSYISLQLNFVQLNAFSSNTKVQNPNEHIGITRKLTTRKTSSGLVPKTMKCNGYSFYT